MKAAETLGQIHFHRSQEGKQKGKVTGDWKLEGARKDF